MSFPLASLDQGPRIQDGASSNVHQQSERAKKMAKGAPEKGIVEYEGTAHAFALTLMFAALPCFPVVSLAAPLYFAMANLVLSLSNSDWNFALLLVQFAQES